MHLIPMLLGAEGFRGKKELLLTSQSTHIKNTLQLLLISVCVTNIAAVLLCTFKYPYYMGGKKKLCGLSPLANYTDRTTAACRRS
jgi:hypothetical protein